MDQWIKDKILGTGSFGIVTLWKHSITSQKIAVKQCRTGLEHTLTEIQKKRWSNEIDIMLNLHHPNIVESTLVPPYLHNALMSALPVLCMEYCSKGDLRQTLNLYQNCCGLSEKEVRNFLADIKNALEYLHNENITHRDLKPENILLQDKLGMIVYKLTDLGYAKEVEQNGICSSFVGTLQYLAPELFLNDKYSNSVDYWSFGLVSHEVITGMRPFLPQSPPVLWMNYVKSKRHEHICIYQSTSGFNRYSSRLFSENHLSQCFQHYIERWLQLALEWDAQERGKSKSNETVIFSQLENTLNKKILLLFCTVTYAVLSYEVDCSTTVSTLQHWIERDTNLKPESQTLLSHKATKISENDFAIDYYSNEAVMIYVYHRDCVIIPGLKIKLPELVRKMLENPLGMLNFFYLKRTVAQTVYFLQKELNLIRYFFNACKTKILFITNISQKLSTLCEDILMELNKLISNRKMCANLINFDVKCYHHLRYQLPTRILSNAVDTVNRWQSAFEHVSSKTEQLLTVFRMLKIECDTHLEAILSLKNEFKSEEYRIIKFDEYLNLGYKCYENLPTDKEKLYTPTETAKIIFDFLKFRNDSLKNKNLNEHFRKIYSQEIETKQTETSMQDLKRRILTIKSEIMNIQFMRHKDLWQLIANSSQEDLKPHFQMQNKQKWIPDRRSSLVMNISSNAETEKCCSVSDSVNRLNLFEPSSEAEIILTDNQDTRNKILNDLEEILQKYRIVRDESESIDWSFLNTDERN